MAEQSASFPQQPVNQGQSSVVINVSGHQEKKLLLEWISPSRPHRKRDKDFYTTVSTIAVLICIILFFLQEILVMFVVVAFVFLVFVLSMVPPEQIEHRIYNTGIQTGIHFHPWEDLMTYRFESRWGYEMLYVQTRQRFPGALYLLLGAMTKDKIENAIGTAIVKRDDIDNTWMDSAAEWLSKKVPLEKDKPNV